VSIGEVIEGIAKSFGEDKAATHEKVDVSLGGESQDQIENMVLESPRASFFTIASDNDKIDFQNDFEELRKRVIVLDTDASEETTRKVQLRQADMRAGLYEPKVDKGRLKDIRRHHSNIPIGTFIEGDGGEFIEIVSRPLVEQEPVPAKFVEGRFDNKKLMDMIQGVCLFHHDRRMKIPAQMTDSGNHQLVTTPADAFHGMKIFGENMVLSALNLKELDRILLQHMRDNPNTKFTTLDLQTVARAEGLNPNESTIRKSLENMKEKLYVEKHDDASSRVEYMASFLGKEIALEGSEILDWEKLVERSKEVAKEVLDDRWADKYISEYCEGNGLIVTHPLTGEEVDITESDEFEEEAQEALDDMEKEFDDGLYGSEEDDSEPEESEEDSEADVGTEKEPVQGTL
jgi:hypothetical protein